MAWLGRGGGPQREVVGFRFDHLASEPIKGRLNFFAPDFALRARTPWCVGEVVDMEEFEAESPPDLPTRLAVHPPSQLVFNQLHTEILRLLQQGDVQKLVPIVTEAIEYSAPLSLAMFTSLLQDRWPGQFTYGLQIDDEGMCGVSPEVLFQVRDGVVETMALAGTGRLDSGSLLEDPKEMLEHNLVIENLLVELRDYGTVDIGHTVERPYGSLKHLFTPMRVHLDRPVGFSELCERLHPTAALGGWPRTRARQWLEEQSFHDSRRRFGAPFGYLRDEEMFCVVAIRGVQWQGRRAQIGTGCGVVAGSQAESEWRELNLKRAAIYELLGLNS